VIVPELEDQAFPFQRGLAFAEDIFHLVVPLEIEVYEILVDASVQRSVLCSPISYSPITKSPFCRRVT
jgi:hypothetical protein